VVSDGKLESEIGMVAITVVQSEDS
jgi:hypothetical protein